MCRGMAILNLFQNGSGGMLPLYSPLVLHLRVYLIWERVNPTTCLLVSLEIIFFFSFFMGRAIIWSTSPFMCIKIFKDMWNCFGISFINIQDFWGLCVKLLLNIIFLTLNKKLVMFQITYVVAFKREFSTLLIYAQLPIKLLICLSCILFVVSLN